MSSRLINKLPDPPVHLSDDARQVWMDAGMILIEKGKLTGESLKKLADLCYWEDQRFSVMEKLRNDQATAGSLSGKNGRSVHLKNLKAIKQEIDAVRKELGMESYEEDQLADTPSIPGEAYEYLPFQLANCCSVPADPDKKDMLLLSLTALVAAHLPKMLAEHANGYYSCSLNVFLADSSGAGKQIAAKIRALLLSRIPGKGHSGHHLLRSIQDELTAGNTDGGSRKMMRLVIETDSDRLLHEAGTRSISSLFEKAFTAVPLVNEPGPGNLSVVMTDDHHQLKKVSMKAGRSLYSSFLLYTARRETEWQSNRPDRSTRTLSRHLSALMTDLEKIRSLLMAREEPITVELTPGQWQMIDDTFAEKVEIINELGLPPELHTVNENSAIYTLKLAAICSALRTFDEDPPKLSGEYLNPADDDVIAALWITDTCLKHTIRLQDVLPGISNTDVDARGNRYLKYYNILPVRFETGEALELAEKLGIPPRSAKRYLNGMIEEKKVIRLKRGVYQKIT